MADELKVVQAAAAPVVAKVEAAAAPVVAEAHAEAESWLSKHKWPIMLALVAVALVAIALAVR